MSSANALAAGITPTAALEEVRTGAALVTANQRLARTLRRHYDLLQRASGAQAWISPAILPWRGWLDSLWEACLCRAVSRGEPLPARLGTEQERILWERVIARTSGADDLLQIGATAEAARKSWELLHAWKLDLGEIEAAAGDDTRAFLGWARKYERLCEDEAFLDQARLPAYVADRLDGVPLPGSILLSGFDEFTPQQAAFWDACRRAGSRVEIVRAPWGEPPNPVRAGFPDRAREIRAAACWARDLLERGSAGPIGVVLPDLESVRGTVERIFDEVLDPAASFPGGRGTRVFNISAGLPLPAYPVVRAALLALELDPFRNALDRLGALLRSHFLGGADAERTCRAALDARLRGLGDPEVPAERLRRLCLDPESNCPALARMLGGWLRLRLALPERQRPSHWIRAFSALLSSLGWPGERVLNSREYQAAQEWNSLLSEFAALDGVAGETGFPDARTRLARMANGRMYQPETDPAPIQILGYLEASGMRFERLWLAGMHDEAWPGPAKPDPFLPAAVQRARGLPRASPERELEFARLATGRLLASAPEVVVSYPRQEGGRELAPSPLIDAIPECDPAELSLERPFLLDVIRASSRLETFEEDAPPVAGGAWQRGGSRVFQLQALCPFRAFAELRLSAEALDSPGSGLNPRDRGTLVHAALENVWNELKTHQRLSEAPPGEIEDVIRDSVALAMDSVVRRRRGALPPRFADLERRRVERLVGSWLELEKSRSPFTVVRPEGERYFEVGGIRARVRIDRIDCLEDGRSAIIDYKTGRPSLFAWAGERPSEPQVPLYAVTHQGGPLGAVLLGQVRTGEVCFKGFTSGPPAVPGAVETDLAARIAQWRTVLERLGSDFRAGRAEVDPKDPSACRSCSLACLCRVAEVEFPTSALNGETS
jgi:probable DNA repair protein